MDQQQQYAQLIQPSWAPPAWVFGPAWTVLYLIIAVSFGVVFYKTYKGQLSLTKSLPFVFNLAFNLAFTPIQFGLKNNFLASIDILLVLATLVWALVTFWRVRPSLRWIVYANLPYLLWVSFATALQLAITWLNRG